MSDMTLIWNYFQRNRDPVHISAAYVNIILHMEADYLNFIHIDNIYERNLFR